VARGTGEWRSASGRKLELEARYGGYARQSRNQVVGRRRRLTVMEETGGERRGGSHRGGKGGRRPRVQIEDDGGNETITLFGWAEQLVGVRRTYVMLGGGGRRYG
jgi:hypothetical protein